MMRKLYLRTEPRRLIFPSLSIRLNSYCIKEKLKDVLEGLKTTFKHSPFCIEIDFVYRPSDNYQWTDDCSESFGALNNEENKIKIDIDIIESSKHKNKCSWNFIVSVGVSLPLDFSTLMIGNSKLYVIDINNLQGIILSLCMSIITHKPKLLSDQPIPAFIEF